MPSQIHLQWSGARDGEHFRTGVSLHSHTLHSRESLDCVEVAGAKSWWMREAVRISEQRYFKLRGTRLNLKNGWWTPPLGPQEVWSAERNQIEELGLGALVSLTDHDDIEAPMSLQVLEGCRGTPISVEWTVPFGPTVFHLGVHNLPPAEARAWFAEMDRYRSHRRLEGLREALRQLSAWRDTLVILNHPLWDESGTSAGRHAATALQFLDEFGEWLHALELNGLRPWSENRKVLAIARDFGKPVVAGGDRHAAESNAVLNLTRATSFEEFTAEIREGCSDVLILDHYREPHLSRVTRNIADVLRTYDRHPNGWRRWSDRMFCPDAGGNARSLGDLFAGRTPEPIAVFVGAMQLASLPHLNAVRTISLFGLSDVKLQFTYDTTYEQARQQVLNRLAQMPPLPNGAQPTISPTSPIGEIYRYRVVGPPGYTLAEIGRAHV